MKYINNIETLLCEAYILEQICSHSPKGITREQLIEGWKEMCMEMGYPFNLSRTSFVRHKKNIEELGFCIECGKGYCYSISNPQLLTRNRLLSCTMESLFELLMGIRYRKLGKAVTPRQMTTGTGHLFAMVNAIESGVKVQVRYEPFDRPGYDAVLHPYCVRTYMDRWYVLAHKEHNSHNLPAQVFALDRVKDVQLLTEKYPAPKEINPLRYFDHAYGIYVNKECPPQRIRLLATHMVSDYLNSLPLHSSQYNAGVQKDGRYLFHLKMSVTPDFVSALMYWGSGIEVLEPQSLREELNRKFHDAAKMYEG